MNQSTEDVIRKVMSMRRLADHSGTGAAEGETARAKADQLMVKHNLTEDDVEPGEDSYFMGMRIPASVTREHERRTRRLAKLTEEAVAAVAALDDLLQEEESVQALKYEREPALTEVVRRLDEARRRLRVCWVCKINGYQDGMFSDLIESCERYLQPDWKARPASRSVNQPKQPKQERKVYHWIHPSCYRWCVENSPKSE